jgi:predicted TIM-barrel fold metal-dependent hydrolase
VPAGACDCHVHVFGPAARYPFWLGRAYTPGDASIEDLLALHDALGIGRVIVVHPSPYGTDNACTVDAVRKMGERARGIAVIDTQTSDAELADMHKAGVRGARVNLESAGQHDPAVAAQLLRETARRVAPLGWHVQTYTVLPVIASLHDAIEDLPTPLVIDHFGRTPAAKGVSQPGFDALLSLVKSGKAYVKLSAPHRISDLTDCADAAVIARALIDANPERMLWGTDWPHPGAKPGAERKRDEIEPFNPVDDGHALNRLREWTIGSVQLEQILVENPARLYGF